MGKERDNRKRIQNFVGIIEIRCDLKAQNRIS